jgi:hypothetical protein
MHGGMKASCTALLIAMLSLGACAEDAVEVPTNNIDPMDLVSFSDGKADGSIFDPNRIVDDFAYEDGTFLTKAEVQSFLEYSPYGRRSRLADLTLPDGRKLSSHLVDIAVEYRISPLVLLVRMQVEQSLVSYEGTLTQTRLNKAMGCGCPDFTGCASAYAGISSQLVCSAQLQREYLDDMKFGGTTVTGWRMGLTKYSEDDVEVTPANYATAALYTYTPWTLQYQGGNWLYWNVYRKFVNHALGDTLNHHWIGGDCSSNEDCAFEGGQCVLLEGLGVCTQTCEGYCPEAHHHPSTGTFCANIEPFGGSDGACLSVCDENAFPYNEGCPEGLECAEADRFGEPAGQRFVCAPDFNATVTEQPLRALPEDEEPVDPDPAPSPHD